MNRRKDDEKKNRIFQACRNLRRYAQSHDCEYLNFSPSGLIDITMNQQQQLKNQMEKSNNLIFN